MANFKDLGITNIWSTASRSLKSTQAAPNDHRRDVGVVSAVFLIVNRLIGTGIFSTPSSIIDQAGSPGLALILWAVGALISFAGLLVYLEFGSMIPKNGGEKNYLEYVYNRPKFMALGTFSVYVFLLGWAASNSTAFGQYILAAANVELTRWNQRMIGFGCLTFSFLIHALLPKPALYLQNLLGTFKVVVLCMIIIIGWVGWAGGGGIEKTHNFRHSFQGSPTGYGVVTALYNVIWSFVGYSNANYALAEARNPERILKWAAPAALVSVAILYMLANISYLGVVPLDQIKTSGNILAADFFYIVWGHRGRTALSVFVALSALGNVMVVIFGQARLVQELGRASVLPLSRLWGSNRPFHTPMMALFEHWAVSVVILLAPPPGDAYNFIANLITYPLSVVNAFVALALCIVYIRKSSYPEWKPKIRATLPVAIFFLLANLYLIASPFVPPKPASANQYKSLPYWIHCVVGLGFFGVGFLYWLVAFKLWPKFRGYTLRVETYVDSEGWPRQRIAHFDKEGNRIDDRTALERKIDAWVERKVQRVEKRVQKFEKGDKSDKVEKVEQNFIGKGDDSSVHNASTDEATIESV